MLAKDVSAATYDFLLGQTGSLDRRDVLLACVAATAADGAPRPVREILVYGLQRGLDAGALREALLEVAPLAGAIRAEQALAALGEATVEAEKPSDPFASLLEPRERKEAPRGGSSPEDEAPSGPSVLDSVHGERAARVRARIAGRSKALAGWLEDDLYKRVFARQGLTVLQRALVALGASFPLDARESVADWVSAARTAGADEASLWATADTLARLFKDGPEVRNALAGFGSVLGRRIAPNDD